MTLVLNLLLLGCVALIQNMAFTWVGCSRNSGDPSYHRYAAVASNGVWFITNLLIMSQLFKAMTEGEWWKVAITGVVYVIATTEGSVLMMKILLKRETGNRKVGANG